MSEERDAWTDILTDAIIKIKFGDDVAHEVLQDYRNRAQKIHKNEMILK